MPNCPHCMKDISEEAFILHEVHCQRFLMVCPECKDLIPKSSKESHFKERHKKKKCEYCKSEFDSQGLELHKTICDLRPKPCLYCGAIMELAHLIDHEEACGSRTEKCENCRKNVVIKDMPNHLETCLLSSEEEYKEPSSLKRKTTKENNNKKYRGK